jgi:DNA-binding response OmpR family regulator
VVSSNAGISKVDLGADDYIPKPYDLQDNLAKVWAIMFH